MKGRDILIAGCGTGSHSIETAQRFPEAKILAIDISRTSLAYARRKTREAGIHNIEYAQADVLELGTLGRTFDLIEAVGVLHHLSDPAKAWQVLESILRPGGLMLVGVFSALAERRINAQREFIQERQYGASADDIRRARQELIHRGDVLSSADFFSISGCRALWLNAIEQQFTIPDIKALIEDSSFSFLGFEVRSVVRRQFEQEFTQPDAALDLDCWDAFEQAHPSTFTGMYMFWVRKAAPVGR